jgi:putative Holliday junction resolvase
MPTTNSSILALDVGDKRVGVAITSRAARLPRPLTTLERGEKFLDRLREVIMSESVDTIVVGLPRNLDSQHTAQTVAIESFTDKLSAEFKNLKIYSQDEALTSHQAETELQGRGKTYQKADIDSLAAVYILEDWLADQSAAGRMLL